MNTQTNTLQNCFSNSYTGANNQPSPDVWYRFTLASSATVQISHCGSGWDTYMHLLNSTGSQIAFDDDNGPLCTGLSASISTTLAAGTYYVVSEGYNTITGSVTTSIKTTDVCPVNTILNLTCFIQGYWDGTGAMLPVLANQGIASVPGACDSMMVELHNSVAPYAVSYSTKTIMNTNGIATCTFPFITGSYYIVLKHRNALETWSAVPVIMSTSPVSYNFSTSNSQAYGANQVQLSNGAWAIYSGDLNVDQNIDLLDTPFLETAIGNFSFGYYPTDLNGDGNVDLLDTPVLETNISNFVFCAHP